MPQRDLPCISEKEAQPEGQDCIDACQDHEVVNMGVFPDQRQEQQSGQIKEVPPLKFLLPMGNRIRQEEGEEPHRRDVEEIPFSEFIFTHCRF